MEPIYKANAGTIGPGKWSIKDPNNTYPLKEIKMVFTSWNLKGNTINIINMEHLTPIIGKLIGNLDNDMSWEDARMEAIKEYCILEHPDFDLLKIPYVLEHQPGYFRIYHTIIELEKTPIIKGIITQTDRDKKIGKLFE